MKLPALSKLWDSLAQNIIISANYHSPAKKRAISRYLPPLPFNWYLLLQPCFFNTVRESQKLHCVLNTQDALKLRIHRTERCESRKENKTLSANTATQMNRSRNIQFSVRNDFFKVPSISWHQFVNSFVKWIFIEWTRRRQFLIKTETMVGNINIANRGNDQINSWSLCR